MKKSAFKKIVAIFACAVTVLNAVAFSSVAVAAETSAFEQNLIDQGFPYSYRVYLMALHAKYPEWQFKALVTDLDFNEVVAGERNDHKKNFTNKSGTDSRLNYTADGSSYRCTCNSCNGVVQESPSWYAMSSASLAYYLNPLNFLDEKYIFMFEYNGYDENYQNIDGVNKILKGTFMEGDTVTYVDPYGNTQTINKSYAQIIMEAAAESGASPYFLASRIKQEVGVNGSDSVSGVYPNYVGVYNFYNIGAYSSATDPVAAGLEYAFNSNEPGSYLRPWLDPETAIKGGAQWISNSYISKGQNTLYLQKFNVTSNNRYSHQYQTNAHAPSSEAYKIWKAYVDANNLSENKVFCIPVYKNIYSSFDDFNVLKKYNISFDSALGVATGTVTTDSLNVRNGPGTTYNYVATANNGQNVTITEQIKTTDSSNPLWYHITYASGDTAYDGWVSASYIWLNTSFSLLAGQSKSVKASASISADKELADITYSSSAPSVVSVDKTSGAITALAPGKAIITATSATGQTDSYRVSVDKLEFTAAPAKTKFVIGDEFESDGTVQMTYSDGTTVSSEITEDMCSGYNMAAKGQQTVSVSFREKQISYDIWVYPAPSIANTPQRYYKQGSTVNYDAKIKYPQLDGTSKILSSSDSTLTVYGAETNKTGIRTITINNDYSSVYYNIFVYSKAELVLPDKLCYIKDEPFDITGAKIKFYSDSTAYEEVQVTEDMCSGYKASTVGEQTITVTFADCSLSFTVSVISPSSSATIEPIKLYYVKGSDFATQYTKAVFNNHDGTAPFKVSLKGSQVSGFNSSVIGEQEVTVGVNGISQTYTVTVFDGVLGNVDGDENGDVTLLDVLSLMLSLGKGTISYTPQQQAIADCDCDGYISMRDALVLFEAVTEK